MKHYPLLLPNENPPHRGYTLFPNILVAYTLYSLQFYKERTSLPQNLSEQESTSLPFSSSLLFCPVWNSPSNQGMSITLHRLMFVLRHKIYVTSAKDLFTVFQIVHLFNIVRHLDLISKQKYPHCYQNYSLL